MITNDFKKAKELFESSNNILFTTHERTDGDDLGSVLALAIYLKSIGKKVTVSVEGGVPTRLDYLPHSQEVNNQFITNNYDLLVVSGCSDLSRVNNQSIQNLKVPTINFDHHPDNKNFATVNIVDFKKSAVAELVYDFFQFCQWPISQEIALCLLTGIITDTGMLMHSNTTVSTFEAAGELMRRGARISQIANNTFTTKSVRNLNAWGKALQNSYFNTETKVIYSVITEKELKELGNPELSSFEGLVETLNKVPEAKFAMFLKEDGSRIKGSLRGDPRKGIDVQKIAQDLGGGGHKWAAGFSMVGKLSKTPDGRWQLVKNE